MAIRSLEAKPASVRPDGATLTEKKKDEVVLTPAQKILKVPAMREAVAVRAMAAGRKTI